MTNNKITAFAAALSLALCASPGHAQVLGETLPVLPGEASIVAAPEAANASLDAQAAVGVNPLPDQDVDSLGGAPSIPSILETARPTVESRRGGEAGRGATSLSDRFESRRTDSSAGSAVQDAAVSLSSLFDLEKTGASFGPIAVGAGLSAAPQEAPGARVIVEVRSSESLQGEALGRFLQRHGLELLKSNSEFLVVRSRSGVDSETLLAALRSDPDVKSAESDAQARLAGNAPAAASEEPAPMSDAALGKIRRADSSDDPLHATIRFQSGVGTPEAKRLIREKAAVRELRTLSGARHTVAEIDFASVKTAEAGLRALLPDARVDFALLHHLMARQLGRHFGDAADEGKAPSPR